MVDLPDAQVVVDAIAARALALLPLVQQRQHFGAGQDGAGFGAADDAALLHL